MNRLIIRYFKGRVIESALKTKINGKSVNIIFKIEAQIDSSRQSKNPV
jgi:hypothetical protein